MKVDIRELKPQRAVCMSHCGPYYLIGQTFEKLGAWKEQASLEFGIGIALFYDDPSRTPSDELRSDAGAIVAADFVTDDPSVHLVDVAGGEYAATTHHGSYDGLPSAWGEFLGSPLPEGYTYRNAPPFESYIRMSNEPGGADSQTDLHLAIQKV